MLMPTLRIVLAITILGALPAVCSERQPIQCDAQCVEGVKNRTRSYKIFLGATDEEWQTAFAGANEELAQGDWSQRLSEIQQEYCGTPGKVDYKKVGAMEMAMARRLALERGDVWASFRNDPESTSAIKHFRVQALKEIIFQAKIDQFRVDCYVPPGPAGGTKKR